MMRSSLAVAALAAAALLAPASAAANPWPDDPRVAMTGSKQVQIDITRDLAWWAERGITTAPAPERYGFRGCETIGTWTADTLALDGEVVAGIGDWCLVAMATTLVGQPWRDWEWCYVLRHEVGHALGLRHEDGDRFPVMANTWQAPADCNKPTGAAPDMPTVLVAPDAAPTRRAKSRKRAGRRHVAVRDGRLRKVPRRAPRAARARFLCEVGA